MARYDSLRKIVRNKALKEYAKDHPELSYRELGKIFSIDGSRVWRILNGNSKKGDTNGETAKTHS